MPMTWREWTLAASRMTKRGRSTTIGIGACWLTQLRLLKNRKEKSMRFAIVSLIFVASTACFSQEQPKGELVLRYCEQQEARASHESSIYAALAEDLQKRLAEALKQIEEMKRAAE